MSVWEKFAHKVQEIYGVYVDWEERFFICPECEEPIYEDDWRDSDYCLGHTFEGNWYCPVCENVLVEVE